MNEIREILEQAIRDIAGGSYFDCEAMIDALKKGKSVARSVTMRMSVQVERGHHLTDDEEEFLLNLGFEDLNKDGYACIEVKSDLLAGHRFQDGGEWRSTEKLMEMMEKWVCLRLDEYESTNNCDYPYQIALNDEQYAAIQKEHLEKHGRTLSKSGLSPRGGAAAVDMAYLGMDWFTIRFVVSCVSELGRTIDMETAEWARCTVVTEWIDDPFYVKEAYPVETGTDFVFHY